MSVAVQTEHEGHILLTGVSWATYESLVADMEDRRHVKLTYDRGDLEIMTPSNEHEKYKSIIGRLLIAMVEELEIPMESGGSPTCKSKLLEKGLEPDECYWIQNEATVRKVRRLDLAKDPAPDLAIEIEFSRTVLNRLEIYAALGIPEVWRWTKDGRFIALVLENGRYREVATSIAFPFLEPARLAGFLTTWGNTDAITWSRGFKKWVRDELKGKAGR